MMRDVYPGFLQLTGFMSMNLDQHVAAHHDLFKHLVEGDGDSAEKHRDFYDEYLAVMDLTAEFYLQTVETVFIEHALPKGEMQHRGQQIDPSRIRNVALMTVEGERDDISGVGQTEAAHRLCHAIPDEKRVHYLQPKVGHYGVFNGSRFRAEVAPRIADFIRSNTGTVVRRSPGPAHVAIPKGNGNGNGHSKPVSKPEATARSEIFLDKPFGTPDDLTRISGIGKKLAVALNRQGIYHFWQLAGLRADQIAELDKSLGFPGRIARDNWIDQARRLAG
jgi:poly(3-hydroxybutyrate) depolymerase